jgi:formate/nitrite transporter FocA (FNT family)
VGCGIPGAVLFTFGLLAVVHWRYALYTGTAGFVEKSWESWVDLGWILAWNVLGCISVASAIGVSGYPALIEAAKGITESHAVLPWWSSLLRAVFCGFLMTTAVKFAREGRWLPLIWAVPVFILGGFYHSIADAFYYALASEAPWTWSMEILGNLIGCNLWRVRYSSDGGLGAC